MAYIGSIISIWIVISVFFGFAIGWLARGRAKGGGRSSKKKQRIKF